MQFYYHTYHLFASHKEEVEKIKVFQWSASQFVAYFRDMQLVVQRRNTMTDRRDVDIMADIIYTTLFPNDAISWIDPWKHNMTNGQI